MPPPTVDLPQELYGSVIQFVSDKADLVVLLYVSKAVHHEAKRVLYGSVDLAYNHLRIYAWFRMIASSPHLALLVQSLTFGIQSLRMPSVAYPWFEVIARGLRSLTNLKELNLKKKGPRSISRYAQILDETPFRLKTFRNHMFDFEPTIPFLTSQPDITTWYQCLAAEPSPQSSDPDLPLLPLLSDAAIPSWLLPTYHSRNITRLHTAMAYQIPDEEHHTLNTLVGYGRTLTALVLDRDVIDGCSKLEDFVTGLAECLPLLESIYLWHRGDLANDSSAHSVVGSFSSFTRLTTLSIQPPACANADSLYMNVLTAKDASQTASLFVQGISTLTRVAFPPHYPVEEAPWYAKTRDDD